ncbi:MAG: polyprenyl synthetase family protein [Thermodesulfobacteriota bacterium]
MSSRNIKEILLEKIGPDILKIEQAMTDDLAQADNLHSDFLREILEFGLFNGGKRIRPLLVLVSGRLSGGGSNGLLHPAIGFEYLHAATLFHDDVIDRATERRGRPALNHVYGEVGAILGGDYLHARAMALVGRYGGKKGLSIFTHATTGMVDGEFLQLKNASDFNLSEEDYFKVIEAKTALLISAACEIGSLIGGGDEEQQNGLRQYGKALGYAFQIVDDILDYQGDQKKTGKAVGNDFQEAKMTLPLIACLQRVEPGDRKKIITLLESEPEERAHGLADVCQLMNECGAVSYCRKRAEESAALALEHLELFADPGVSQEKEILTGLVEYVLKREK